jgi:hypothetical protein
MGSFTSALFTNSPQTQSTRVADPCPDPHLFELLDPDPDPQLEKMLDPDPHFIIADPQPCTQLGMIDNPHSTQLH